MTNIIVLFVISLILHCHVALKLSSISIHLLLVLFNILSVVWNLIRVISRSVIVHMDIQIHLMDDITKVIVLITINLIDSSDICINGVLEIIKRFINLEYIHFSVSKVCILLLSIWILIFVGVLLGFSTVGKFVSEFINNIILPVINIFLLAFCVFHQVSNKLDILCVFIRLLFVLYVLISIYCGLLRISLMGFSVWLYVKLELVNDLLCSVHFSFIIIRFLLDLIIERISSVWNFNVLFSIDFLLFWFNIRYLFVNMRIGVINIFYFFSSQVIVQRLHLFHL